MVDGESKASLRSAVIDALLEYRRTYDMACAEDMQVEACIKTGVCYTLDN